MCTEKLNYKILLFIQVADVNPYSSSYFVWIDAGSLRHERFNNQPLIKQIPSDRGILLLNVDKFTKQELELDKNGKSTADFSRVDRIGAGVMGCDIHTLGKWHSTYYNTFRHSIKANKIFSDKTIHTFLERFSIFGYLMGILLIESTCMREDSSVKIKT